MQGGREGVGGESMMDGEKDRDRRKGMEKAHKKKQLKANVEKGKEDKRRRGTSGQRKDSDG